jgi:hypothetical protein
MVQIAPVFTTPGSLVATDLLEHDQGPITSPLTLNAPLTTVRVLP